MTAPSEHEDPQSVLASEPGILRACTRCGHSECPFCRNWCDACLMKVGDEEDDEEASETASADANVMPRWNAQCAYEMLCDYGGEPPNPKLIEFMDRVREVLGTSGCFVQETPERGLRAWK